MILAKVLEGTSCVGSKDMKEPPKDPVTAIRYDSTQDHHKVQHLSLFLFLFLFFSLSQSLCVSYVCTSCGCLCVYVCVCMRIHV